MIAGFIPLSFIDYPKKRSCVIFLSGCNFNCGYCHNEDIVSCNNSSMDFTQLKQFLRKRKGKLEGVVISGGEPTLHRQYVYKIATFAKQCGYCVKLDTNGSNPKFIKTLIENRLIDYIAMDIKSTLSLYHKVTNTTTNIEQIKKTINLLFKESINYEFRTTIMNEYHKEDDFKVIGELIKGAKQYSLQHYKYSKKQIIPVEFTRIQDHVVNRIKHTLSEYVENVVVYN
ncbi:anaerobic ribonucleoside-triphosphate reductase activating protein [Haloplasma contractile]|uniref:4-hydroxyphenylacetate-3-hydroxylase small chain protein n=1 Tax=Haloplasma contractile SSD-17B TaxID=1033810 RepID=F7Q1V4_9MOLU|nr:anaerobic ribonucleoside-triphosphate reductase activating protein [Haloplasma contractile]ERJ12235.1 4-hydroxyphenylacetate-3-hydroxylase small chain protein [Haloplasma contractile SSD-17B]